MSGQLQRLVLDFRAEELVVRAGLQDALEALDGRVDVVGTSGFTTREDVVLCTAKGAAAWMYIRP